FTRLSLGLCISRLLPSSAIKTGFLQVVDDTSHIHFFGPKFLGQFDQGLLGDMSQSGVPFGECAFGLRYVEG
ncbi:unnamed protein product, partial [Aphanomyces euteiches]